MAALTALQRLMASPKTARFVETLRHADLPTGWADDPEIVSMAGDAYREMGTNSPFFRAWHGNGLTDSVGNPQKLYHGTPTPDVTDFAFDPRRIGTNAGSSEGRGFYTVTVPDTAQGYTHGTGNVLELYSNMQKPIELHGSKSLSLPQLKKIIKSTAETEARKMAAEEGEKYTPEWIKDTWISNYTYTPDKPISASIDDVARKVKQFNNNAFDQVEEMFVGSHRFPEVSRATNSATGYDGVHSHGYIGTSKANADEVGDIYVHWFPEQLKATSNRGTFNPADPNIYRGLIPLMAAGGALAAMSPDSAQAAEWPKQGPNGQLVWPADMPGYRNTEPGLEAPLVDPVDIATAPIGMTTAAGKALAMAAEPGIAYGTDKALGALLGMFQRNRRTGGGGGV